MVLVFGLRVSTTTSRLPNSSPPVQPAARTWGAGFLSLVLAGMAGPFASSAFAANTAPLDTAFINNVKNGDLWGFNGVSFAEVYNLAVQSDMKVIVAGRFTSNLSATGTTGLGRLNADGTPDTAFNTNFAANNLQVDYIRGLAVLPDGKILAGTTYYDGGVSPAVTRNRLVLLNSDGTLATTQPSWQPPDATGFDYYAIHSILKRASGKVLVGGAFPDVLVQLDPGTDFALDPNFTKGKPTFWGPSSSGGTPIQTGNVQELAEAADGSIIVAGSMSVMDNNAVKLCGSLVKLSGDGVLDGPWCTSSSAVTTSPADPTKKWYSLYALALEASGDILVGGQPNGGTPVLGRVTTSAQGVVAIDTSFAANVAVTLPLNSLYGEAILVQSDGGILLGGKKEDDLPAGVRRFKNDGTLDGDFDALSAFGTNKNVYALALHGPGILAGGGFTLGGAYTTYGGRLARFGEPVPPAAVSKPGAPASVSATGGNAQVAVSWTAPTNDGGAAVTGYNVQYSTSSSGTYIDAIGACAPETTNGSTATTCTMTGLTNGTTYYFKVAAINTVGTGDYAGPADATPQVPVNGACGSANGTKVTSAPSQSLCNAGKPSAVEPLTDGQWSWSCLGSNGGTTQMCSAGTAGGIGDAPRIELTDAAGCTLKSVILTPPPEGGPANQVMPYGVVDFELGECTGSTVTVKLTFTGSVQGHTLWKYGRYPDATGTDQWYEMPGADVSGKTITYIITDNGIGDSDPNYGAIADPAGPGYPQAPPPTDIPTLSEWGQILTLLLLMLMVGWYLPRFNRP